jgi:hypothetical protein
MTCSLPSPPHPQNQKKESCALYMGCIAHATTLHPRLPTAAVPSGSSPGSMTCSLSTAASDA